MDRRVFQNIKPWADLRSEFRTDIPHIFNMANACCDSWAEIDPGRRALTHIEPDGATRDYSYGDLREASNRLANALTARGLRQGDRCAVLLPQCPEVLISHFACFKLGMISLPLFTLFGEDGLEYRLKDSGARCVITNRQNIHKILNLRHKLPDLEVVYVVEGPQDQAHGLWQDIDAAASGLTPVTTLAEDPALIIYTSGTTGPPKGALHAHRFLLGHRPAVELQHEFFPKPQDVGWTPADWAWIGGLMNTAMACLYYGVPLVSHRMGKFDPEAAYDLIRKHKIQNMFLPPTALKLMRQVKAPGDFTARTIMSGGESLGADMLEWGRAELGVTINETYGQTECNLCLTSSAGIGVQKPGAIGKAVPGFDVAILDDNGNEAACGEVGEICIHKTAATMFTEYWNAPAKTQDKFTGDWMKSGDLGWIDDEGFITFSSRDDDVITSSGYRIGPTEIENCLTGHSDVAMAAAVGIPDPLRTEIVKAFVVLREGAPVQGLKDVLVDRVRQRVSPHCAPRQIEFVDSLPMTATGKIIRRELRER